ncbi:MAG: hypothetical protein ACUVT7_07200 [Thermoplasmata archaeon]
MKEEMPRGYGMGRGGYWWHHGRGYWWPGYPVESVPAKDLPKDAIYVGPCRCGFGPHAYYRLTDGRIVHAAGLPYAREVPPAEPEPTYDELEAEVESLRNRVQELEKKLKETAEARKR